MGSFMGAPDTRNVAELMGHVQTADPWGFQLTKKPEKPGSRPITFLTKYGKWGCCNAVMPIGGCD
jgi:hypothetical protein